MTSTLAASVLTPATAARLAQMQAALAPYRDPLVAHPMYEAINSLDRLRIFMRQHVFAVWDFMSLLKWLQRELTCTTVPWYPQGDTLSRRLINEIVLAEESDTDGAGGYLSHYEMYLQAMQQCGADSSAVERFVAYVAAGEPHSELMKREQTIPSPAHQFVVATFDLLDTNSPHRIAAAFALGREDLIPDMFRAIVADLNQQFPGQLSRFHEYLQRHIELDGDEHTPLALRMLAQLCGDDEQRWQEATDAAIASLKARQQLWDGVLKLFGNQK